MNEIRTENGSARAGIICRTRESMGKKLGLLLLFTISFAITAVAQWTEGQIVYDPPAFGNYYSMKLGSDGPPLPWLPLYPTNMTVYALGSIDGATAFAYDDRPAMQRSEEDPPAPGEGGEGEDPGVPLGRPADIGTGLYIDIGPLTNNLAWLALTNTINGTYYQLESRTDTKPGTPWQYGQIVKYTGSVHQVSFNNARTDQFRETYYRGVGGSTVVSIYLDPDYNLAVEPATNGGSGQAGKFLITLSDAPSSSLTIVYKISGSATNGTDYSTIGAVTNISSGTSVEIPINPLFDSLPEFDESVTLSLVLTNGYLVNPNAASATMKIYDPRPSGMAVAIHDSGWTKFNGFSGTNWNYFVMPESVKEALRSDGTPYVVLSDLDIANGALMNTNGTPKYPIFVSLAAESIRDEEIGALTNYVTHGGFVFAGSSSFTKGTNGGFRGNFALSSQMGVSCSPSSNNWTSSYSLNKLLDHRIVSHIPFGSLTWRMPAFADEMNWGTCVHSFPYSAPHPIWTISTNTGVQVIALADASAYITANQFGSGQFIYDAAMQPLIGHGGNGPGMYAYMILRRAIEWAFESNQQPVVKLSPWPYKYDAAYMVRHDLENYVVEIAHISDSAQYENSYGAKGDYYFCTGAITNQYNFATIVSGLQTAVNSYGATIASHNGGLPNPNLNVVGGCIFNVDDYNYFHWGPDDALDISFGYDYASNSVATSFAQIDSWVTNQSSTPRLWVAPFFNATREDCYQIQEQLNVKIAGEQKLGPFPHWNLSTRTDGKRYSFLSEPVSDWFVGTEVAQVVGPWQGHSSGSGVHDSTTLQTGVDFYYTNGFLLNFYAHSLTASLSGSGDDKGAAAGLMAEYVAYCADTNAHKNLWAVNARDVYNWWNKRSSATVTAKSYLTNTSHVLANVLISGSQDTNTTIDVLAPNSPSLFVYRVLTNNSTADASVYRITGNTIKVRVGTSVTNVQLEYFLGPRAQDDSYTVAQNSTLSAASAVGVLSNDFNGTWTGLRATNASSPHHGSLTLNSDGSFTYTPTAGFVGMDCFSYQATDGTNDFGIAMTTLEVLQTGSLFNDDFTRCDGRLNPWQVHLRTWTIGTQKMQGSSSVLNTYGNCYLVANWTNYSIEAQVQIPSGAFGGGLGARLDSSTGSHYAAWIYPDNNVINLVKFSTWSSWGYNGINNFAPMAATNVAVGSGWHPLKLVCSNSVIRVFYHGTNVITKADTDSASPVWPSGGVSLDMWTDASAYTMSVSNLVIAPVP